MSPAHASNTAAMGGGACVSRRITSNPSGRETPFVVPGDSRSTSATDASSPGAPAATRPPARRITDANAAISLNISAAAPRVPASGLHSSNRPAASGLSVPKDAEDACASASVATVASRHAAHASLAVSAAETATSASTRLIPACVAVGERSITAASPCTMASLAVGSAVTARRIASPAATRTAGCGCAHSGGTASPSAAPRHSSGATNGTHRSNATATATDASSVGRDVCSARATAPSCRRRFRARSAAAAAAAAAAARSDDDASRASAPRSPATRSTNPDRGSNPSSRIRVSTPARPGLTPDRGAVRSTMSGTAVSPAATASETLPSRSNSATTSAARSGSTRDVAAVARATAR